MLFAGNANRRGGFFPEGKTIFLGAAVLLGLLICQSPVRLKSKEFVYIQVVDNTVSSYTKDSWISSSDELW